eukprot:gnl/TRDRNA2_/TRDRNA2_175701_c17_seq1.p1 gnl/TRDRNA2_/TRDRNA2_175701_c17~~gnl/TRDRNA2_/TRDRNA2_175701_c17_seq1.p1  ORF type:complete len:134 (-),score=8.39 gnl/TRDRNA2_/TRDRNA2_175701_c17_seq1:303-704(-)
MMFRLQHRRLQQLLIREPHRCKCLNVFSSDWLTFDSCMSRSFACCSAFCASVLNIFSANRFTVANDHAVFASSWTLNFPTHRSAVLATAVNSFSPDRFSTASTQAALARDCGLNSLTRCSRALANAVSTFLRD